MRGTWIAAFAAMTWGYRDAPSEICHSSGRTGRQRPCI